MAIAVYLVAEKPKGKRKRKKWAIRWIDGNRKLCYESCRTSDRKSAEIIRQRKYAELNRRQEQNGQHVTWEEFARANREFLEASGRADNTVFQSGRSLDHFARICSPDTPFDVTPDMVHRFVIERAKEVEPATVNKDLRGLKAVFNRAVERELLERNPFNKMKPLTEVEKMVRVLSPVELQKLAACLRELSAVVYAAFLVALATAMRIGELANLQWEDVDLDTGDVLIHNNRVWRTKGRRNRYEWLPEFVRDALRLIRQNSWNGYVFADREPRNWYWHVQKIFDKAVKKAKIKHVTWHDLRETALTGMAEGGAGVWVLQRIAGHSSPTTTERHYVDVQREAIRAVIDQHGQRLKVANGG